jgi:hypothetical protein
MNFLLPEDTVGSIDVVPHLPEKGRVFGQLQRIFHGVASGVGGSGTSSFQFLVQTMPCRLGCFNWGVDWGVGLGVLDDHV